jgi:hypothetical protein
MKWHTLFLLGGMILFSSCEKTISFQPDTTSKQVVAEATIEVNQYPLVFLSGSIDYFSSISAAILARSFIHDASISISNGTQTIQLREYAVTSADTAYKIYYYTIDSSNMANAFRGEAGKNYSLKIIAGGKEYTASTGIPELKWTLDSLWWRPAQYAADSNRAIVTARITERIPYGQYIRYFSKRNRENFLAPYNSAFDDQVVNGTTYTIDVDPGIDRNNPPSGSEPNLFYKGDTVTMKWANIDKTTYEFWRTLEYNYASVGNPFSSPSKVKGNINGALGYFGGYNSMYKTIIIPR